MVKIPHAIRKKCDYCGLRRMVDPETLFCAECREHWDMVTEKYFDGDPLLPLKTAEDIINNPNLLEDD